jgi:hypothetical protein
VVTWNTPEPQRELRPHPFQGENIVPPSFDLDALVPGSMWLLRAGMNTLELPPGYVTHPHSYFTPGYSWGNPPPFVKGTPVVYMGTTRVEESNGGRILRVNRHLFLAGGMPNMLKNLNYIEAV